MKTVTSTEFRQRAASLFSEVENGETLIVVRHGKAIAEIIPCSAARQETPSWQRPALRLASRGAGLSAAILDGRAREDLL